MAQHKTKQQTRVIIKIIVSYVLIITAVTSIAEQNKNIYKDKNKNQEQTLSRYWYQQVKDTLHPIQGWAIKQYNNASNWAGDQYKQHPEWKNWSDKASNTANKARDTIQNYFTSNNHASNKKQTNNLTVPTNASQKKIIDSMGRDNQLDPLESPDWLISPPINNKNKEDSHD